MTLSIWSYVGNLIVYLEKIRTLLLGGDWKSTMSCICMKISDGDWCPSCKEKRLIEWKGSFYCLGIILEAYGQRCNKCGQLVFGYKEIMRQDQLIAEKIIERGIRTGAEFMFIRKSVNLLSQEVAELFGVRPETVSRWENRNQKISRSIAYLMGRLYRYPNLVKEELKRMNRNG